MFHHLREVAHVEVTAQVGHLMKCSASLGGSPPPRWSYSRDSLSDRLTKTGLKRAWN